MPRKSKKLAESSGTATPVADVVRPDQTETAAPASGPPSDERNAQGQFLKNNAGGPGNPHARHCARMLEMFRNSITDEEMFALSRVLFERAITGDMGALKMIWQYKLGKPLPAPHPDRIDRDEWDHFQKDAMTLDEMRKVLGQLPSRIGPTAPPGPACRMPGQPIDRPRQQRAKLYCRIKRVFAGAASQWNYFTRHPAHTTRHSFRPDIQRVFAGLGRRWIAPA
jgi:hypothetical protein